MAVADADKTRVTLDRKGIVQKVHDEKTSHFLGKKGSPTSKDPAIDGEHYQWRLEEYRKSGIPDLRYKTRVSVATNQLTRGHLNTVKIDLPKLVLLDCGLWGAYKRAREYGLQPDSEGPQRDFGMIENGHAWRAQYISTLTRLQDRIMQATEETCEELRNKGAVLGLALARLVAGGGVGAIKLWQHTKAERPKSSPGLEADDPDWNSLHISFPDLHLSDRWPDVPRMDTRHGDQKKRLTLQRVLRDCQSWPSLIRGSKNGQLYANSVQMYLEDLETMGLLSRWAEGQREDFPEVPTFTLRRGLISALTPPYVYTPAQFLAEKDVVDRALRIHSTWFCGPGRDYVTDGSYTKEPVFGKKDDALYEALLRRAPGDAGPAFDLVNFLVAIYRLRTLPPKWADAKKHFHNLPPQDVKVFEADWNRQSLDRVRVRQLGDMCEMWMNHEFLYHGFWVRQTGAGKAIGRFGARRSAKGLEWSCEDFQARKDEYHFHPDAEEIGPHLVETAEHFLILPECRRRVTKWYTFNHMNTRDQKYRHVVGDMIADRYLAVDRYGELEEAFHLPPGEISRRQYLLFRRMESIKAFSLPLPGHYTLTHGVLEPLAREAGRISQEPDLLESTRNYLASFYLAHLGKIVHVAEGRKRTGPLCWAFDEQPLGGHFRLRLPAGPGYCRRNALGQQEILWNKLILDLFTAVGGESVYGNHDGYRGDPLLWDELDSQYRSHGWLSVPGLWFEHGHRWDQYNRDGCAFGSGMTNLVYYYMHVLGGYSWAGEWTRGLEGKFTQERQLQQASAATWFLLVHCQDDLAWFKRELDGSSDKRKVYPFGIYVCGHSHTAKLIDIELGATRKERERLWDEKTKDEKRRLNEEEKQRKQREKEQAKISKEEEKQRKQREKEQAKISKGKKDLRDKLAEKRKQSDEARKFKLLAYGRERNRPYQYKSEGLAEEEEKRYKVTLTKDTDDEALAWLKRQGPPRS